MKFTTIRELKKVEASLLKYGILSQYKKAKNNLLSGNPAKYFLAERQPKGSGLWYFRINKKY